MAKKLIEEAVEKIDDIFAEISLLNPADSFVTIHRETDSGPEYCGRLPHIDSPDEIKNKWGGGKYHIRVYEVKPGEGAHIKTHFLSTIAGLPKLEETNNQNNQGLNVSELIEGIKGILTKESEVSKTGLELWKNEISSLRKEQSENSSMMLRMMSELNTQQRENDRTFFATMLQAKENKPSGISEIVELVSALGGLGADKDTSPLTRILNTVAEKLIDAVSDNPMILQLLAGKLLSSNAPSSNGPISQSTGQGGDHAPAIKSSGAKPKVS